MKRRSVLFVCTGNTCRSPMAEALMRHFLKSKAPDIVIASRGLHASNGQPMSEGSIQALRKVGVDGAGHVSRALTDQDVDQAEWILAMTDDHVASILSRYPNAASKVRRLAESDIGDPIGGSPSDYEKCRIDIQNALLDFVSKLTFEGSSKS